MSECNNCRTLRRYNWKLSRKIEELETKAWGFEQKLEAANNTIRHELEPRIAREERAYDHNLAEQTGQWEEEKEDD